MKPEEIMKENNLKIDITNSCYLLCYLFCFACVIV